MFYIFFFFVERKNDKLEQKFSQASKKFIEKWTDCWTFMIKKLVRNFCHSVPKKFLYKTVVKRISRIGVKNGLGVEKKTQISEEWS